MTPATPKPLNRSSPNFARWGYLPVLPPCKRLFRSDKGLRFRARATSHHSLLGSAILFSERELTFTFAICCRLSDCRLSSVTLVRPTQAVQIFGSISTAENVEFFVAPVLNFVRLLPIGDNTKCRSPKNGKNWGFSPTEGDRINPSRQHLARKRIPWVCYSEPNMVLIGQRGSVEEPPKSQNLTKIMFFGHVRKPTQ